MQLGGEGKSRYIADQTAGKYQRADLLGSQLPVVDTHVGAEPASYAEHQAEAEIGDHEKQIISVGKRRDEIRYEIAYTEFW